MRFALSTVGFLTLLSVLGLFREARAGVIVFDTVSTADQMISSPLLGTFALDASGTQTFTIDTTNGTANVKSAFQGSDLPDPFVPGLYDTYNLYNIPASTTGTVTTTPSGYNISFSLLFELDVTSGSLNGLSLVTTQYATFAASNVPALPFPVGTSFFDPSGPAPVTVYLKNDFGPYPAGTPVGMSYDRVVTISSVVPEPPAITLLGIGVAGLCCYGWRFRATQRSQ
jgi:hypothetical protein